jgi:hypothetical protein
MQQTHNVTVQYLLDHADSLILVGGLFFVLFSLLAVSFYSGTGFLEVFLVGSLIFCGVLIYIFEIVLKRISRRTLDKGDKDSW